MSVTSRKSLNHGKATRCIFGAAGHKVDGGFVRVPLQTEGVNGSEGQAAVLGSWTLGSRLVNWDGAGLDKGRSCPHVWRHTLGISHFGVWLLGLQTWEDVPSGHWER